MNADPKDSKIDKWIARFSLITGLVAMYYALQANELARQANEFASRQIAAQVVASTISEYGAGKVVYSDNGGTAECSIKIQLSNLGGAVTALTDYKVTVFYKGETIELPGYGQPDINDASHSIGGLTYFRVILLVKDEPVFPLDVVQKDYRLEFPVHIDSF